MKRFLKSRLVIWLLALSLAGATHYTRPENDFLKAQKQTVLIQTDTGSGSGVVMARENRDGKTRLFVWTAAHVVSDSDNVKIRQFVRHEGRRVGSTEYSAKVIARSDSRDCALLWLDAPLDSFRAAEFDSEHPLAVGSGVMHIGNAMGEALDGSASVGIVSQSGIKPETIQNWPWPVVDQVTCAAFYGCSGGPVFNRDNQKVVGLLVGGIVGSGYIGYIPVREISDYARTAGVSWAVYGNYCPGDDLLNALAKKAERPKVLPVLIELPPISKKKK